MSEAEVIEIGDVLYERPRERVARIVLNRPDKANAQNLKLLYGLNEALDKAAADNSVHAIIIAAAGKHFSSGHGPMGGEDDWSLQDVAISNSLEFGKPEQEGQWAFEEEVFFGLCWRWRNIPKPTIAEVQGKVIAGGLMLVWPFDLVVASEAPVDIELVNIEDDVKLLTLYGLRIPVIQRVDNDRELFWPFDAAELAVFLSA